jgi:6-phosphogluconolactonase
MADDGITRNFAPKEIIPGVMVAPNETAVARAGARFFVEWAWQSIARSGTFRVALSGGSTPRAMYRSLADGEYRLQVDWARVHVYWGDERCVPPDHPDSNYGMTRKELLLRVPIPPQNVHRMEAERSDLGRAAEAYEELLRKDFERDSHGFPRFDLILLGLGTDGHTASLFPGTRGVRGTSRWVSTPKDPRTRLRRMTLTLPVINAARRVLFLVNGAEKAATLRAVLHHEKDPPLPAELVVVPEGERLFLVDELAASLLPEASSRDTVPPPAGSSNAPGSAPGGKKVPGESR